MSKQLIPEGERFPVLRDLGVPPGRRVELPGRGTTFVRECPGPRGAPALFLLHGLGATAGLNWVHTFGALAREFRVVAMDLRGHGHGIRSRTFSLVDCADDVAALADELGIEEFIPVGYSMGGPVAQLVWRRHPERVSGIVLCATSRDFRGRFDDRLKFLGVGALGAGMHGLPRFVGASGWGWLTWMARFIAGGFVAGELRDWTFTEVRGNDPRLVLEAAAELGRFSSRAWIGGVDVPTAVIAMLQDQLVPVRRQLRIAQEIPDSHLHTVEGDHLAAIRDPAKFITALMASCREVSSAGRASNALWNGVRVRGLDGLDGLEARVSAGAGAPSIAS